MSKTISFKTLGCRLNQFETDAIASQFINRGYKLVDFEKDADICLINTCTVTNQSDKKSRNTLNSALKGKSNVVVTGCMATHYKSSLEKDERISLVIDNEHKSSIFTIVENYFSGKRINVNDFDADVFNFEAAKDTFHTRSMIKIQDGCNNFCTYCIVPMVRGRAISRPKNQIIENINKVLDYGFKEIVLTGVNISQYKYENNNFENLIESVLNIDKDFRLRISSIEPDRFTNDFPKLFQHPKLTPHLHLCLQSGSDKILKAMRRMYSMKEFYDMIEKIRTIIPDFNFTTDLIVGFPGETEEDFEQTLAAINKVQFGHIHTFKYSLRKGTKAEKLTNHINGKEKNRRSEIVRQLAEKNKIEYRKKFIKKTQTVLVEKIENNKAKGYGSHYIPISFDIDDTIKKNNFYNVKLHDIDFEGKEPVLIGDLIQKKPLT